ncbi:hypothetical protein MNB_SV-9-160 [hydrothermal vent metagenome]|uniref:Uncharacterized protein n=1 Tax=hydrothermal vent metagenome TaxID=652676 RepID=A0A1W1BQP3_9ZZZZ
MTKQLLEDEIETFIQFHNDKNRQLDYFIQGIIDNEDKIYLNIVDCRMQKWLYERKDLLYKIYGTHNMEELHSYHEEWHDEYQKICNLLLIGDDNKKSFFKRLKGNNIKSLYEKEKDKIDIYVEDRNQAQNSINKKFEMMKKRLSAMQNRTFEEFL